MLRRLFFRRASVRELDTSCLYDECSFYGAFTNDLRRAKQTIVIESHFLTMRRSEQLRKLSSRQKRRSVKVTIHTRHPIHHDEYLRIQAWQSIKLLKKASVKIKLHRDYRHRKLAIIDYTVLWEGSLNILSQNQSRELMRRTASPALCSQMASFTGLRR